MVVYLVVRLDVEFDLFARERADSVVVCVSMRCAYTS